MPLASGSVQGRWRIGAERGLTGILQELLRNGGSFSGRERNCCFLNMGGGKFGDVSSVMGVDFPDDGRAAIPLDWDQDGDLDLCVLNRSGPQIRFLRNGYRGTNQSVQVRLEGTESNRDAVGARLTLTVRHGEKTHKILRTLRAGDGYLSQRTKWLHFGLGADEKVDGLSIRWPSGNKQQVASLEIGGRYIIREMQPPVAAATSIVASPPGSTASLQDVAAVAARTAKSMRTVLAHPMPIPVLDGVNSPAAGTRSRGGSTLVTLWNVSCGNCQVELAELAAGSAALEGVSLVVQPFCTDDPQKMREQADLALRKRGWKQTARFASANLLNQLQLIHDEVFDLHDPLPLPCSFLIDRRGRLSVIYKGRLELTQLLEDAKSVGLAPPQRRELDPYFAGKWSAATTRHRPTSLAMAMLDLGWENETLEFARRFDNVFAQDPSHYVLLYRLGQQHTRAERHREAADFYRRAVDQKPDFASGHYNLGLTLRLLKELEPAVMHLALAAELEASDHPIRLELGRALNRLGRVEEAQSQLERAVELGPDDAATHFEYAVNCAVRGEIELGIKHYKRAADLQGEPFGYEHFRRHFLAAAQIGLERHRSQGVDVSRLEKLLGEIADGNTAN